MAERHLQELPQETGPSGTGPLPLTIRQCCMQWIGVKYVWFQEFLCRADNQAYRDGCILENSHNKGPTRTPTLGRMPRTPTAPRITTNVKRTAEVTEANPILCQVIHQILFHRDNLAFSPSVLTNMYGWPNLLAHPGTDHADHVLTGTAASNTATPEALGISKIN